MRKLGLGMVALLATACCAPANATTFSTADYQSAAAGLQAMKELNLITLGDFNAAHDVEGKTWVGGNLNATQSFTAGLGSHAHSTQGAVASSHATITVAGKITGTGAINLNDGANGGSGTVGTGHYGVTVAGDSTKINFNAAGATVKVGGSMSGDVNFGSGADVSIHGFVHSIVAGNGSIVRAGSVGSSVSVGNNSSAQVASGDVGTITIGANSSVATGGSVGGLQMGSGSTATIVGNAGQNLNLSDHDTVTIGGTYQSANVNGLGTGTTVTVNGSPQTSNAIPLGWTFNAGATVAAPALPPTIDLSSEKTAMIGDLTTLSSILGALTANATLNTSDHNNINVSYDGTVASTGYAVINVNASDLLGYNGTLKFNLLGDGAGGYVTTVVNVIGANSGSAFHMNFGDAASMDQTVIWNFVSTGTQTQTVSLGSEWFGSVLAPTATLSNTNAINGTVVAKLFNQGGEVHLGNFAGTSRFLITGGGGSHVGAVPEPASWMSMLAGFGLVGSLIRRNRRRERPAAA